MAHAMKAIFPDLLEESLKNGEDASLAFFELANASQVAYRLHDPVVVNPPTKSGGESTKVNKKKQQSNKKAQLLWLQQDVKACGQHTGGIVWETSYLLLAYLLAQNNIFNDSSPSNNRKDHSGPAWLGDTLEVGAGCGLLQALVYFQRCTSLVLTEEPQVVPNLEANVARNKDILAQSNSRKLLLQVAPLDWTKYRQHAASAGLKPHSLDTILGTDVLFTPSLVEPLLETMHYLLKSDGTGLVYLCVQVRCAASHALFLKRAPDHGFVVQDISADYESIPACQWGSELECHLFRMTMTSSSSSSSTTTTIEPTTTSTAAETTSGRSKLDPD